MFDKITVKQCIIWHYLPLVCKSGKVCVLKLLYQFVKAEKLKSVYLSLCVYIKEANLSLELHERTKNNAQNMYSSLKST